MDHNDINLEWRIPHASPVTLQKVDRKLVTLLQINGRFSLSDLGSMLRMSKASVSYRLTRLRENGVIRGFATHFDMIRPPLHHTLILANHTRHGDMFREWINVLVRRSDTTMVVSLFGMSNTLIWTTYRNVQEIDKIISWIKSQTAENPLVFPIRNMQLFPLNYSGENIEELGPMNRKYSGFRRDFMKTKKEPYTLTPSDIKLMKILQQDSRIPLIKLEEKLDRGKVSIKKAITKLIRNGVIVEFSAIVNPYAFYGIQYFALWVDFTNPLELNAFKVWLGRKGNANMLIELQGKWSALSFVYFRSNSELDAFEEELRSSFKSLNKYELAIVREQGKLDWLPDSTLENAPRMRE